MQVGKTTARAMRWLADTETFYILQHFEHVCNLCNQSQQVFSLHTPDVFMGPFSYQISTAGFSRLQTAEDIQLFPQTNDLSIDGLLFEAQDATHWEARPDWSNFTPERAVGISHKLQTLVEQRMHRLHQAIVADDHAIIGQIATQLAGLGAGLTPAGDDVLMGTIFALHVLKWDQAVINLIGESTIKRTASLSAAFLNAAVLGEAVEPWHDIVAGKPNALESLLSIGSSSGKDAWTGFTACFQALHRKQ